MTTPGALPTKPEALKFLKLPLLNAIRRITIQEESGKQYVKPPDLSKKIPLCKREEATCNALIPDIELSEAIETAIPLLPLQRRPNPRYVKYSSRSAIISSTFYARSNRKNYCKAIIIHRWR